jgi:plastocyanin
MAFGAAASLVALLLLISGGAFSSSASGSATASRTVTVSMKNFLFAPKTVNISRGDRVVWANTSSRPHTATKGGSFDTRIVRSGKAAAVRFNGKGTYRYICSLHPQMTGKVIVG